MAKGYVVVGTGFGDEGKGITTDFLCSKTTSNIVVRFSGGQQAGHNVKIGEVSHIHSNFGSGTLRGVPSFFSEHCTIYPLTIYRERRFLIDKGVRPTLYIHPLVNVTTPADIAYNRVREKKLNHGSCGLGVGATMSRNINTGYKLFGVDLTNDTILFKKIQKIYEYYHDLISGEYTDEQLKYFEDEYKMEMFYFENAIKRLPFFIKSYDFLKEFKNVIFEGSQGILLDMDHGIFPNVTYSNTTSKNALTICKKIGILDIEIYYPTRCYHTRHGEGWMSNNEKIELINTENEINVFNEWQGNFKVGEMDYDLLNYALDVDDIYSVGLKKNLVVTCLDQRPGFKFDYNKLNMKFEKIFNSFSPDSIDFKEIT